MLVQDFPPGLVCSQPANDDGYVRESINPAEKLRRCRVVVSEAVRCRRGREATGEGAGISMRGREISKRV